MYNSLVNPSFLQDCGQSKSDNLSPSPSCSPEISRLAQEMIIKDSVPFFKNNCLEFLQLWISLLQKTFLPRDITCTDTRVAEALNFIDGLITSEHSGHRRLGYVRLAGLSVFLDTVIRKDRRSGRLDTKVGNGNASIAIDTYQRTLSDLATSRAGAEKLRPVGKLRTPRDQAKRNRRIAKRWAVVLQEAPLLVVVFSDKAEKIMYVFISVHQAFFVKTYLSEVETFP